MRPLKLMMQAFGPYARTSEVDFGGLREGGLFLIHGQTGAGKTSILDGICFGLFGTSSGADRAGEALRSDLAPADLATEVSLEFALGKDVYRVVRRPRQMLAKKRGEGKTTSQPKGELYKLTDSEWTLVASGDKKTDESVIGLLGMTQDQFRQVVVLPQGQFRKFLSSSSDAREALLETLFRTEKYRQLADRLSSLAKVIEEEINAKKQSVSAHLASIDATDIATLEARLTDVEAQLAEIAAKAAPEEAGLRDAHERRDRARAAAKITQELASARARLETLRARRGEMESITHRLEDERRSRPVLQADSACQAIERDGLRFDEQLKLEQKKLAEAEAKLKTAQEAKHRLEAQRPEAKGLETEQERLREIWKSAKRLKEESETLKAAQEKFNSLHTKSAETEAVLERLKQQLARDIEAQKSRVGGAAKLEALRAENQLRVHERETLHEEIEAHETASKRLQDAERFVVEARTSHEIEHKRVLKLRMDYHLSQAALLARELKTGEPCPVCGSREHPKRAAIAGTLAPELTPKNLEALEAKLRAQADDLSAKTAKRDAQLEARDQSLAKLGARFPGTGDRLSKARFRLAQLDGELRKHADAVKAAEAADEEIRMAETLRAQLESAIAEHEADLKKRVAARDEARVQLAGLKVRIEELEAVVPPATRDLKAITDRGQMIKARLDKIKEETESVDRAFETAIAASSASRASLATLTEQLVNKRTEFKSSCQDRDRLLGASGFATLAAARAAGLPLDEAKRLETERRRFDDEWAAASSRAKELTAEAEILPAWALDLAARESEFAQLDRERTAREGHKHTLEAQAKQIRAARERLKALGDSMAALEERYKTLGRLAGVAQGQPPFNLSRVNFPRFVLASRLDEVLDRASRRLYAMSRGQFILKRSLSHEDKRRSAGLELVVEDSFTGSTRPTASLSGGEGFMASLCLALGLADVVQSELGGVRLDAVFVDEGFGTLDAEALELAMKTLGELQAGGRMVGIISHVPELKEQIARRLFVRKSPEGSSITWESLMKSAASFTEP